MAENVLREVERQVKLLSRQEIAEGALASQQNFSAENHGRNHGDGE